MVVSTQSSFLHRRKEKVQAGSSLGDQAQNGHGCLPVGLTQIPGEGTKTMEYIQVGRRGPALGTAQVPMGLTARLPVFCSQT